MNAVTVRVRQAAAAVLASLVAATVLAPGAAWAKPVPNPEYTQFSTCPALVKHLEYCLDATATGGSFTVGNATVPITNPIVLRGGVLEGSSSLLPATDGDTLSLSPQKVPGGLLGIGELGGEVTATTELALPPEAIQVNQPNLLKEEGTALLLPIKVKLDNPLLGATCVIGSESSPVVLRLTTGRTSPPPPNHSISGSRGTLALKGEGNIAKISGAKLVDNSFAAPAAEGCGLLFTPLVNLKEGLPAAGGRNTAILEGTIERASAKAVKKAHVLPKPPKH